MRLRRMKSFEKRNQILTLGGSLIPPKSNLGEQTPLGEGGTSCGKPCLY